MEKLSVVLPTFEDFDFSKYKVPFVVVYKNPSDFPEKFVARVFDLNVPQPYVVVKDSKKLMQKEIQGNWSSLNIMEGDDPVIMGIWLVM